MVPWHFNIEYGFIEVADSIAKLGSSLRETRYGTRILADREWSSLRSIA